MLPFTSLDGVTTAGPGVSRDLEGAMLRHTLVASITGAESDSAGVVLQGSHDGEAWFTLTTVSPSLPNQGTLVATADTHLVRYVRANIQAGSVNGTPSVTATIVSG